MPISDRAKAGLVAFIRSVVGGSIIGPRVDYLAVYPCKVVAQNSDGTLELQPDDARLPPYSNVPIRYGVPGVTATVPAGSRCLLTFAGADPQKRIVVGWEAGTVLGIVLAGGSNGVARNGDSVAATAQMSTWMSQVAAGLNGLSPGSVSPATPASFGSISAGSTKVKAG